VVIVIAQTFVRLHDGRKNGRLVPMVTPGSHVVFHRMSMHYDLAAGVGIGLKQYRIHVHMWFQTGCLRLYCLGTAYLSSLWRDGTVQRHILWLEWHNTQVASFEHPAQCGNKNSLSGIRCGALHHQGHESFSGILLVDRHGRRKESANGRSGSCGTM